MIMGVAMGTANQEITQLKIRYFKDFFSRHPVLPRIEHPVTFFLLSS